MVPDSWPLSFLRVGPGGGRRARPAIDHWAGRVVDDHPLDLGQGPGAVALIGVAGDQVIDLEDLK